MIDERVMDVVRKKFASALFFHLQQAIVMARLGMYWKYNSNLHDLKFDILELCRNFMHVFSLTWRHVLVFSAIRFATQSVADVASISSVLSLAPDNGN